MILCIFHAHKLENSIMSSQRFSKNRWRHLSFLKTVFAHQLCGIWRTSRLVSSLPAFSVIEVPVCNAKVQTVSDKDGHQ